MLSAARAIPRAAAAARWFSATPAAAAGPSNTERLRDMLHSDSLEFIMEAHNGLSAKIVQEAGFKGIWGSGLSISAAMGVRDANEASWTQVLEVLDHMVDASDLPLLLDGDTGYGNFNNARRLVTKLEKLGVAGVCLEDKLFPKTNSLLEGDDIRQPLASVEEFCGKLEAVKATQRDPAFQVVARVEAFIAGWGLDEALARSNAYVDAGADAILMHSKRSDPSEIEAFMKAWNNKAPVIIVPTKYYTTPTDTFREWGVSMVIWANHNMRSAVKAMQDTTRKIYEQESLEEVETSGSVVPVKEVFRLQGEDELRVAEKAFLR